MYSRILVPIDGSPTSIRGLIEAVRLASLSGATLRLMHVLDPCTQASGFETPEVYCNEVLPRVRAEAARILEQARAVANRSGIAAEAVIVEKVGQRVCDLVVAEAKSWGADLVVIGSHGRRGLDRAVMGSDAELIVRHAPVPVLVVRHPEGDAVAGPRPTPAGLPVAVPC